MMLDAGTPTLRQPHPNHYHIYDARGRLLRMVIACNPETGEVIRYETINSGDLVLNTGPFRSLWRPSPHEFAYFFLGIPWLKISSSDLYNGGLRKRHGFWPAPLRVVPLGGPVPAGVPYRVGDGAREQRVDIPNGGAGIAYLDDLIDNAGVGSDRSHHRHEHSPGNHNHHQRNKKDDRH